MVSPAAEWGQPAPSARSRLLGTALMQSCCARRTGLPAKSRRRANRTALHQLALARSTPVALTRATWRPVGSDGSGFSRLKRRSRSSQGSAGPELPSASEDRRHCPSVEAASAGPAITKRPWLSIDLATEPAPKCVSTTPSSPKARLRRLFGRRRTAVPIPPLSSRVIPEPVPFDRATTDGLSAHIPRKALDHRVGRRGRPI